jgi:hypothetical protein
MTSKSKKSIKSGWVKICEWLYRYTPSEIAAIITAYLGFWYVHRLTQNHVAASYAAAMTENIGFYGVMIIRETYASWKVQAAAQQRYRFSHFVSTCALLLFEFGPGELLDSLIVRPITIGIATHYYGMELGVLVGKLMADVTFFLPTIALYELKKTLSK